LHSDRISLPGLMTVFVLNNGNPLDACHNAQWNNTHRSKYGRYCIGRYYMKFLSSCHLNKFVNITKINLKCSPFRMFGPRYSGEFLDFPRITWNLYTSVTWRPVEGKWQTAGGEGGKRSMLSIAFIMQHSWSHFPR